jgi:hypothetical protein
MFALQLAITLAVQTAAAPSDFAFRFDHKSCHYEYVDTFRGTYSHVGQAPSVPFALSEAHRQILYTAILESGFFNMPQSASDVRSAEPADTYELEVRANGRFHTVVWTLNSDDPFSRLERFVVLLFRILENHPDVLRLPRRGDGCAEGSPAVR